MKFNLKWFGVLALSLLVVASCKKPEQPATDKDPKDNTNPGEQVTVPDKQEVTLTVGPAGSTTLTTDITAYADWTVSADENYKWISVTPASGSKGTSTLTFAVAANTDEGAKERTATFAVFQGKDCIYDIMVVQASPDPKVAEGDLQFLQAIVAGKLLGEDTPNITDWITTEDAELTAFPGLVFGNDDNGKITVVEIKEEAPFTAFPEVMKLPNVERIRQNNNSKLAGTLFPKEWDTPMLNHIALSHTKMTGVICDGFAASPRLVEIYFDDTDFYGALPHNWASKVLEVALISTARNCSWDPSLDPYEGDTECPYLGYIVPASLDVILNTEKSGQQGDKTQMKVGGVREGHWLGFEKGWGQVRYELFDEAAEKGNKEVWSDWRLLVGKIMDGDDTNTWAWYFSSMGYPEYKTHIPYKMLDWDQTVADKFTAAAKAAHDAKVPIDMTEFGVEVVTYEDSIDGGEVVPVDDDFWTMQ
ncbi:MAG: BACON domain-containing protein [Bacteroidales bacterium]|nr:BACON domain-containing protein [Bacteroidales bacterium]